jgi:hypothetical protein
LFFRWRWQALAPTSRNLTTHVITLPVHVLRPKSF